MTDYYDGISPPSAVVHLEEMDLSERELAILNEIGLVVTQLLHTEDILDAAVDILRDKLAMSVVMIYLLDARSGRHTLRKSYGLSQDQKDEIERRRKGGIDITQQVVDTGKEVFVPDMSKIPIFKGVWDNLEGRSYIKLPLTSRGTIVGVMGLVSKEGCSLSDRSAEFLKTIGREIGIAIDNAFLMENMRNRERHALTLYQLGMKVSSSLSLGSVLESIAEAARELMEADIGLVGLIDNQSKEIVLEAIAGKQTNTLPVFKQADVRTSPWDVLASGQSIKTSYDNAEVPLLNDENFLRDEGVKSFLAVPLVRGKSILGLIEVMKTEPFQFNQDDISLLSRLAYQVVLSIENAQLYSQLHHMAALEERDRLGRELHDNLSQKLGYLKIKASITEDLLEAGEIDKARVSLDELRKVSQLLYTDVREEIFKLRTLVGQREDFFQTLQEYLADYRTYYGYTVDLVVESDCIPRISQRVSSQLLRIIQEALTNVRKHSHASKVLLQCSMDNDQVCFGIEDNGQGFNIADDIKENGQHYGLQFMKERAESINGSLALNSKLGEGTHVLVRVPADVED